MLAHGSEVFLLPELHLIRDFGVVRTLALVVIWPDHRHAFCPLFIRDVEQPHIARLRHNFLDDAKMLAQLLEVHARARIDGKLNHQKSMVKEVVAEARGQALAQKRPQRPFGGGIDIAWGNKVGAQQMGDFLGVKAVVLVLAAVNGLEIERMGQDEVKAGVGTGIGEPIPAEHALGADRQIVAIGRDEFEEIGEVIVLDVGVDELLAGAVQDADIHLAGVQINSAVELGGGGVVFHEV